MLIVFYVTHPIESLAVSAFFVISSFLFFRKARYAENQIHLVLYFKPILVCGMESNHLSTEGVFPSDNGMGTSLYYKRFLLWKYV